MIWALPSLLPPTIRTPAVDMRDLMLDAAALPPGWRVVRGPEPLPKRSWGDENLSVGFQAPGEKGFAYHYVFKFRNAASAMYGHFWILRIGHLLPVGWEARQIPAEWTYQSPLADDWQFGCVDYSVTTSCGAIARYNEYISVFETSMSSMTLEDLEHVLRAIDERMARYLKGDAR